MFSVIGLLCALSNSPIKNWIRFIFIKLEGVNGLFDLAVLTTIWSWTTALKQKEYMPTGADLPLG